MVYGVIPMPLHGGSGIVQAGDIINLFRRLDEISIDAVEAAARLLNDPGREKHIRDFVIDALKRRGYKVL